ncbi:hypothetical protein F5J12DRAFT_898537 [Pisolithus orientalis]|uniref:uncharacterized protein n=1 Tax=Pisolithus orientalis TaxID=936130 RepID=UPI002225001F|nr:uncharacterized protein F5J12DRAFT_898537 [Pisolithus orientalis]KAI5987337.1 hypothetical protein F5J12DRAFT_898537 [Pisolithus orientalis]
MSPMGGSQDADDDVNPFLSEPIIWPTPTVWSDISLGMAAIAEGDDTPCPGPGLSAPPLNTPAMPSKTPPSGPSPPHLNTVAAPSKTPPRRPSPSPLNTAAVPSKLPPCHPSVPLLNSVAALSKRLPEVYSENYIDILETWKESEELQDLGGTVTQHQQLFNKSMKDLDHIFSRLSKVHGIKGVYMLAGKIVNQDVGLAHPFTTAGAEGFFHSHCHVDTDEIIGHFKAHIYNKVSLDSLAEVFEDHTKEAKEVVACGGKGKQCAVNVKKDQSDDEVEIIENSE